MEELDQVFSFLPCFLDQLKRSGFASYLLHPRMNEIFQQAAWPAARCRAVASLRSGAATGGGPSLTLGTNEMKFRDYYARPAGRNLNDHPLVVLTMVAAAVVGILNYFGVKPDGPLIANTFGPSYLPDSHKWLVLASIPDRSMAIQAARDYRKNFDSVRIFQSYNRYYAVVLGLLQYPKQKPDVAHWVSTNMVSSDCWLSSGKNFTQEVTF